MFHYVCYIYSIFFPEQHVLNSKLISDIKLIVPTKNSIQNTEPKNNITVLIKRKKQLVFFPRKT